MVGLYLLAVLGLGVGIIASLITQTLLRLPMFHFPLNHKHYYVISKRYKPQVNSLSTDYHGS